MAYCARYDVVPNSEGLPPFPSGKRETRQHREWIAVYKAHQRLVRRKRGQCERCPAPASPGSVFCEAHRAGIVSNRGAAVPARCPTCGQAWPGSTHTGPKRTRTR